MIEASLTRRQILAGGLAAALAPTLARAAARPVTVGFIYVGRRTTTGGTSRTPSPPSAWPSSRA